MELAHPTAVHFKDVLTVGSAAQARLFERNSAAFASTSHKPILKARQHDPIRPLGQMMGRPGPRVLPVPLPDDSWAKLVPTTAQVHAAAERLGREGAAPLGFGRGSLHPLGLDERLFIVPGYAERPQAGEPHPDEGWRRALALSPPRLGKLDPPEALRARPGPVTKGGRGLTTVAFSSESARIPELAQITHVAKVGLLALFFIANR